MTSQQGPPAQGNPQPQPHPGYHAGQLIIRDIKTPEHSGRAIQQGFRPFACVVEPFQDMGRWYGGDRADCPAEYFRPVDDEDFAAWDDLITMRENDLVRDKSSYNLAEIRRSNEVNSEVKTDGNAVAEAGGQKV